INQKRQAFRQKSQYIIMEQRQSGVYYSSAAKEKDCQTRLRRAAVFKSGCKNTNYLSVNSLSTKATRLYTAVSSSGPSAIILIEVPPIMPRERTPKRLLSFTLLSSFSTQMEDLNSFAFWIKKVAGRA